MILSRNDKQLVIVTVVLIIVFALMLVIIGPDRTTNETGRQTKPAVATETIELRQEVADLRSEVIDLRNELKKQTHPKRIQDRTIDYILRQGEFAGLEE